MSSSRESRWSMVAGILVSVLSAAACTHTTVGTMDLSSDPPVGALGDGRSTTTPAPHAAAAPANGESAPSSDQPAPTAPTPSSSSPPPAPVAPLPPVAPVAPVAPSEPTFVGAGVSSRMEAGSTLTIGTPTAIQTDDLLLALIDADEVAGPRTIVGPAGWTLVPGFPLHNLPRAAAPSSASQGHGTWIFHKVVVDGDPPTASFDLANPAATHGVIVAYRGVDTSAPIHDKSAYGFYGSGETNGNGMGNTTLLHGRQVNLVATGVTAHATYTVVKKSVGIKERFNSGEAPNGLNLVVHDQPILSFDTFGIYTGVAIRNLKSPSASTDTFLFSGTTLVLKPR